MSNLTKTNGHAQETTVASLTDTIVDRRETLGRPSTASRFGSDVPTMGSPSPERPGFDNPHPVREQTLDPRMGTITIPPEHANRTLVLCFDGTGKQFDASNSNIVQLFSLLKKDDSAKQKVYYQV